jgi:UDP-glucose 4-epimerase
MKTLVTGGAGFIGSHLAEKLLSDGNEVIVIDDFSTGTPENLRESEKNPFFTCIHRSVLEEAVVHDAVAHSDLIFHLAAVVGVKRVMSNPLEAIQTNVRGTEIVLRAAMTHRKKVLITSSSEVYGKVPSIPCREDDDRVFGPIEKTRWAYACAKSINEYFALACRRMEQLQVVIVRLFNVVGPRQSGLYGMVIPTFIQQALRNMPITVYGDGRQTRSFVFVGDVVRGMIGLTKEERAFGNVFNLGSDYEITIEDLARLIRRLTGSTSEIIHVPYNEAYTMGFEDMRRRVPDITRIRNLTGYRPEVALEEMLEESIRFYRSSPRILDGFPL